MKTFVTFGSRHVTQLGVIRKLREDPFRGVLIPLRAVTDNQRRHNQRGVQDGGHGAGHKTIDTPRSSVVQVQLPWDSATGSTVLVTKLRLVDSGRHVDGSSIVATPGTVDHVVILVQENHTTDNYFRSMAAYGANVATDWPTSPNPPAHDQAHDRHAYYRWLTGRSTGAHVQFDTTTVLPFYAWLAATGAFMENHCAGFGTNSTPNHLLLVGGQSPTLRNPPRTEPDPVWDMPSLPGHAEDHGVSWRAYTGRTGYPVSFYAQLQGSSRVVRSAQFAVDAAGGQLPALSMVWHDSPDDEHPPADVTIGQDTIWRAVDAVAQAGLWASTVFMLTWDDWGGYDDHVETPNVEHTPDGVQLAYGPRVPLLVFGGRVRAGIDHRWCSHVSIPKTALQLLGLPPLGVPRLDDDPGLADLVDLTQGATVSPLPPAFGSTITQPPAPDPTPEPVPPPPSPVDQSQPVGPVVLRDGATLPPPDDVPITTHSGATS